MVQEMLAARGICVTYETVRQWGRKFGKTYRSDPWRGQTGSPASRHPRCGVRCRPQPCRVDEAGFPFEDLPAGRIDAALGGVGKKSRSRRSRCPAARSGLPAARSAREATGRPGGGGPSGGAGLGRSDQDADLPGFNRVKEPLLGGRFLKILHKGDLTPVPRQTSFISPISSGISFG
jgi:hypothetical protein